MLKFDTEVTITQVAKSVIYYLFAKINGQLLLASIS